MNKKDWAEVLFWIHLVMFILWYTPFFIPSSLWPERVVYHFWYIVIQVVAQFLTGFIMMKGMKKYRIVCPLTAYMQKLRGYDYTDPRNFDHGFVAEFASRFNIKIPRGTVAVLIYTSLAVVIVQYYIYLMR